MDNKYTQNSLKRKNHKSYNTQKEEEPKLADTNETYDNNQPKPDRIDTILDTVETENIANMLRFILQDN